MGKLWSQITREQRELEDRQKTLLRSVKKEMDEWFKPVDKKANPELNITVKESQADPSERMRREQKYILAEALKNYRDAMLADPELSEIHSLAAEYAGLHAVATYGDYRREAELALRIYKSLKKYQEKLDEQALTEEGDSYSFYERQVISANLFSYFERLRDGELTVPKRDDAPVYRVDGVARAPQSAFWRKDERKDDDAPLFTHEPNANDVHQGALGDCYLLSSLSSIASTHPEKIREAMHDDGNGKVTVRFYSRDRHDRYTPVYVTVDKVVPVGIIKNKHFAMDCLWVQTFERAWAASGLSEAPFGHVYCKPVPENVDEIYNTFREKIKKGYHPTKEDRRNNPWIFDAKHELFKWEPTYADIEGGHSAYVTQSILGPGFSADPIDRNELRDYVKHNKVDCLKLAKASLAQTYISFWNVVHAPETLKPQLEELYRRDLPDNGVLWQHAAFEVLFVRPAPLNEHGQLDMTDPDCLLMLNTLDALQSELTRLDFKNADEMKEWFDLQQQNELTDRVSEAVEKKMGALTDVQKQTVKRGVDVHFELARELVLVKPKANDPQDRKLDGHYADEAEKLYLKIEQGEKDGIPMTCDSRSTVSKEIVEDHVYSLAGVTKKKIDGKEFKFVKLRNPWGTSAVAYRYGNGELHSYSVDGTSGYMEMELNDYLNNFEHTYINGPSAKEKANEELEKQLKKALEEFREVKISERTKIGMIALDAPKKYVLHAVEKEDAGGIERTVVKLLPDEPGEHEAVPFPLDRFYELFNEPQIGEVKLQERDNAQAANKAESDKLKADRERSKQVNREHEQKQRADRLHGHWGVNPAVGIMETETGIRLPYIHACGNLRNCFAKTDGKQRNGSDEYYNMRGTLDRMLQVLESPDMKRMTDVKDAASEVGRTARDYLRHCEAVKRSGARRAERVELAKKLLLVAGFYENDIFHPQEALKDAVDQGRVDDLVNEDLEEHPEIISTEHLRRRLAGMLVDKFADVVSASPERKAEADAIRASKKAREETIEKVLTSAPFNIVYGRMDNAALQKEIAKGEETVLRKVGAEYTKAAKREKAAQKSAAKGSPELLK